VVLIIKRIKPILGPLLLGVASIFTFLQYGIFIQPISPDMGFFLYRGQEILRGYLPYISQYDVKTPLTFFLCAGVIFFSRLLGLSQLLAYRTLMVSLGSGTVVLTYLTARSGFEDEKIGFFSGIILMSFTFFGKLSLAGRPKIPMIFFGMLSLYLIHKRKWILAGSTASLSFLTWQPGGTFLLTAFLFIYLMEKKKNRRLESIKLLIGFFLPLSIFLVYFSLHGGFREMIDQVFLLSSRAGGDFLSLSERSNSWSYPLYGSVLW